MDDKEKIQLLRGALQALMDSIDYRNYACSIVDSVGACIDRKTFELCDEALEKTKNG
jgi:hypothetical protein